MPKINVYLPDDLAAAVRQARVPVSSICQQALGEAVRVVGGAREAIEVIREPGFDPRRHPEIGARVASQVTPRLRQALRSARDLAGPDGLVGTEHLLVGLIDESDNLAVRILELLDVDVPGMRDAAMQAVGAHERKATRRRSRAKKPRRSPDRNGRTRDDELLGGLSTNTRLAIAAALEGAIDLGHTYLGSEHLLLGLADQAESKAGKLLGDRGIKPDRVRRAIPAAVGAAALGSSQGHQVLAPTAANCLDDIDRRLGELEKRLKAGGL